MKLVLNGVNIEDVEAKLKNQDFVSNMKFPKGVVLTGVQAHVDVSFHPKQLMIASATEADKMASTFEQWRMLIQRIAIWYSVAGFISAASFLIYITGLKAQNTDEAREPLLLPSLP